MGLSCEFLGPQHLVEYTTLNRGEPITKPGEICQKDPNNCDCPTISKTHRSALSIFNLIRAVVAAPILFVAVVIQVAMWGAQVAHYNLGLSSRVELSAKKSFVFALTSLLGCTGKQIIGLKNKYGQTYRRMDTIVERTKDRGSIILGSIPTESTRDEILKALIPNKTTDKKPLIIDLTEHKEQVTTLWGTPEDWKGVHCVEASNTETPDLLPLSLDTISKVVEQLHEAFEDGRSIYLHCKAGVGRSATILAAYLSKYGVDGKTPMTVNDALQCIEEKRFINLNQAQAAKVHEFKAMNELSEATDKEGLIRELKAVETNGLRALENKQFTYLKHAILSGNNPKKPDLALFPNAL